MQIVDVLIAARARIAQGWCQAWYAKTAEGVECASQSPFACCWCAAGAINSVTNVPLHRVNAEDALCIVLGEDVRAWNDHAGRTQADILALYDLTIERLTNDSPSDTPTA